MRFDSTGLSPALLRAVDALGYTHPTPVQSEAIPAVLRGEDLWASAKTGSGKTAAFVLPLVQRLLAEPATSHAVRALIVTPTRELAQQTGEVMARVLHALRAPLRVCVAIGGVPLERQLAELEAAEIVVGTPGRLLDLEDQGDLSLGALRTLVLDEADRLLSLGFSDALKTLLAALPGACQRLMFSATFPPKVVTLAEGLLRTPTRINVDAGAAPAELIAQRAIEVDAGQRTPLLVALLKHHAWRQALVFVASREAADSLALALTQAGIDAWSLHGQLSQTARESTLDAFRDGSLRVLVATDLATRGIDVPQLPVVVNYDLPRSPSDYTHRIGRTGRAGEPGSSVSFISAHTAGHFQLIERRHGLRLEREWIQGFEPRDLSEPVRDVHGGIKGKRKSKKDKLREAAALAAAAAKKET